MPGLIPQHFINDLIDRVDITEVLGKHIPLINPTKILIVVALPPS